MKWIFALNQKSPENPNGDNYELMALVAVHSAKRYAPSLDPHLIWNGEETQFTEMMRNRGVKIIFHKLSFEKSIDKTDRTPLWKHTAKGAMLRLEIPSLFANYNEKVLYTDVDVMFCDDPSKYIFDTQLFAFSSEFEYDNFVNINTGVMILDLAGAKKEFPEFIEWTKKNLEWIPDYDQGAIRTFFNGKWDRLDQRMNWKPYWNLCDNPIIVHFHGPKPTDFDPITLLPKFSLNSEHIYQQLYIRGKTGYVKYLKDWISTAQEAFT